MAIAGAHRRVNLGVMVFAALLLDFLLWSLVLLGWESATVPADFASTHQPRFVFPFSHGLLASLLWSLLAGLAMFWWTPPAEPGRTRAAWLVAAAVFSHWLLDALVHAPELPLAGAGSAHLGLWLWRDMPLALAVEALIVLAGLFLFLRAARISRSRGAWLCLFSLGVLAFTVLGMTVAPAPPSVAAMAASSLVLLGVVSAVAGWLGAASDRPPRP